VWEKSRGEWFAVCVIGGALAVFLVATGFQTPPLPPPAPPGNGFPQMVPGTPPAVIPIPAPEPNRNEIRLPLPTPSPPQNKATLVLAPPLNPFATDADGTTALMRAAARNDVAEMKRWLALGADVNQMDRHSHTALTHAILRRSAPAVEWLLAHGAKVDIDLMLPFALETQHPAIIEPILRAAPPLEWSQPARTALFAALETRDKPMLAVLLKNHQVPPTPDGARQPLLGYAIAQGDEKLVDLLLECGADPNTALNNPVEREFADCIASKGVRDDLEREHGMTVLMLAADLGQIDNAQRLIAAGAKRGAYTKRNKMVAIHFAARRSGSPQMLQVLLGKSPRPEDQRMRVHISIGRQQAVLYKDGEVALISPVSTGMAASPTPTGEFVVTDKNRHHVSNIYHAAMPFFMRMSCRDFGMHAGELPGYPASHGCIRLPYSSAARFFQQVDVGTLVSISH